MVRQKMSRTTSPRWEMKGNEISQLRTTHNLVGTYGYSLFLYVHTDMQSGVFMYTANLFTPEISHFSIRGRLGSSGVLALQAT